MDRLYDALDAFSSCTGIPVTVYDTENRITREFNAEQKVAACSRISARARAVRDI